MKKEDKLFIIFIIILLLINIIFLICKKINNDTISSNAKISTDITLTMLSESKVTQGAVVSYKVNVNDNIDLEKSQFSAIVLNSIDRKIAEAKVIVGEDIKVYIDTSELCAGFYRVKIENEKIVFKDGKTVEGEILGDTFSVILVEEKV